MTKGSMRFLWSAFSEARKTPSLLEAMLTKAPIGFAGGAYPSFTELPDGRVFSVYYQEALGGNVIQAIFTIDRQNRTIVLEPLR